MTALNLSNQDGPDDGIGGRFVIGWKTIGGAIIAAFLAYSALDRRVALIEARYDAIQEQLLELRADVKQLLSRRP